MIKINIVIPSKYAEESNASVISSILNISVYWIDNFSELTKNTIMITAAFRVSLLSMTLKKDLIQHSTEYFTYQYDMNYILKSIAVCYEPSLRNKDMFNVFIDFNPKIDNILRTIEIT